MWIFIIWSKNVRRFVYCKNFTLIKKNSMEMFGLSLFVNNNKIFEVRFRQKTKYRITNYCETTFCAKINHIVSESSLFFSETVENRMYNTKHYTKKVQLDFKCERALFCVLIGLYCWSKIYKLIFVWIEIFRSSWKERFRFFINFSGKSKTQQRMRRSNKIPT